MHEYKIIDNKYVEFYIKNKKGKTFSVLVDALVFNDIRKYSWYATWKRDIGGYYICRTKHLGAIDGKQKIETVFLHNYIMLQPKGYVFDHINHNTLDNILCNLRVADKSQNCRHRSVKNKNNTSGYRNVSWASGENKWIVQLQVDGKNKRLGKFDDVHEAGSFAKKMREKYYGDFAGKG